LIPVIIITARPDQHFTALSAGVGALLEKPIDLPDLVQAVNKLLDEPGEARLARLNGHRTDFHYYSPSRERNAVGNSP
jgi:DNA-binding response OmpR family regulator